MITHLEADILECEVKWALESMTMNKASGGDGIPLSYFKSWKMMLWKCCTQYASKFGKLSSGHQTRKGQFLIQSQRKAMPKNAQVQFSSVTQSCLTLRDPMNLFRSSLNGLAVFPTFFNLSLNMVIRSSWSEPWSAPSLVFADYIELLHLWLQRIWSILFWCWPSGDVHV